MNTLRTQINTALDTLIEEKNGFGFQRLACQCLRSRWPSLMSIAERADRGEDAITTLGENSDGIIRSMACSLTCEWTKVSGDAEKISKHRSDVQEFIFATPKTVTRAEQQVWAERIAKQYGWKLIVVERSEFLSLLEPPEAEWIRKQHLNLLKTDGDAAELIIPNREWKPEQMPPGALLRADVGIVPFHGRLAELKALDHWCGSDRALQVRLLTGPGGMGKTRLAIELCRRYEGRGWKAGFLQASAMRLSVDSVKSLFSSAPDILVVVDYAETQAQELKLLLDQAAKAATGKVRLLLLARDAGDWWQKTLASSEAGDLLASKATSIERLGAVSLTSEQRSWSFAAAARAFAAILGHESDYDEPHDLDAKYYSRILLLHMAALAKVEEASAMGEDAVLDFVLNRERGFWLRMAESRQLPPALQPLLGRAIAAFALGGGVKTSNEAVEVLRHLFGFSDQPQAVLISVATLLHDCYPGSQWIEPVQPDLLAEHLVDRELDVNPQELLGLF